MSSRHHFLTHEIGSLAKPEWRVSGVSDRSVPEAHIQEADRWARLLDIDHAKLVTLLRQKKRGSKDKELIKKWASLFAIRLQEKAGLDLVYDGEQQRVEMYEYPVSQSLGFAFKGHVRSWDNKYYKKAAVITKPRIKKPWHVDEFLWAKQQAISRLKVPMTGPYTIAAWSYDEYYTKASFGFGTKSTRLLRQKARRAFVTDIAKYLIRPNIKALVEAGATWIQIDEPAVTTYPEDIPIFVEAFNQATTGIKNCTFSIHICFSDYTKLFPHIQNILNCSEYTFEFANRDSTDLGLNKHERIGYEILDWFKKYRITSTIGLGVIDIHSDFIESPQLVRDRILYAVKVMGDPRLVNPSTDCGLRTRTWKVSFAKLENMVAGARLAERLL